MKIRTEEQLLDRLDRDASWRRKELTSLSFALDKGRQANENMFIRTSVALSYAHWEGFIKSSTEYYFNYLNYLQLKGSEISYHLFVSCLIKDLHKIQQSKKFDDLSSFISDMKKLESGEKVGFSPHKHITTKSNLKYDVFSEIAKMAGVSVKHYDLHYQSINNLVQHRNSVAHGENPIISFDNAKEYIRMVRELIEQYKGDLINIISLKEYLAA